MFRTFLIMALTALAAPVMIAEETIGPAIGMPAPDFSALSSEGTAVDFTEITGEQGAVIVFSRSLDWCPFCKKQAVELETVAADLSEAGWTLNLITYDSPEILAGYKAEKSLTYTFLSDPESAMIDAFNLRNMDVKQGSRFDGIPNPAIVFISADGVVKRMLREDGYRMRPAAELLPAVVTELNSVAN